MSDQPTSELAEQNIDYRAEIIRKSIHLCSLSIPIIYYFISRVQALWLLAPVTLAFLSVDILRHYHAPTARLFYATFGRLLRTHEHDAHVKRLSGATHVLISATVCVFIFPKLITITAFAILIISDSAAALVGRRFGSRKFLKKSVEGSAAFFLSALIVIAATPKISTSAGEYVIAIAAALVGTVIEASAIGIDDNLSIPISIGAVMWLLYGVFYPSINFHLQSFVGL
ncbi:MAG TPA: SEC59/DGK1/VTE5 family protein [Bacteroidota bacterium]|nr:SEC59/DGK1/VTE5 family protein [Bacteroidota bacterium]